MNVTDLVFIIIAAITLVGAFRVVTSEKMMHAALWLGLSFVGVAVIFLLLGAEFLAAAQILIYVGAIMTILIFGIMLSPTDELREEASEGDDEQGTGSSVSSKPKNVWPLLTGGGFALMFLILFTRTTWPEGVGDALTHTNNPKMLGEAIFSRFVVPFEVASVILLVALVGAIVLAVKEDDVS